MALNVGAKGSDAPSWFGPQDLGATCEPVRDWGWVQQELADISRKGRVIDACPLNEDGSEFRVSLAMRRPLPRDGCKDSDIAAVWRGAHEWYFEVIYRSDALPPELAGLEAFKQEELQILGSSHPCFVCPRGYELKTGAQQWDDEQRRQWLVDMECGVMRARLQAETCPLSVAVAPIATQDMSCVRASPSECARMLAAQPGAVLYLGSGACEGNVVLGNALEQLLGVDKTASVDDITRCIVQPGDEGVSHIAAMLTEHLLEPLTSTQPTGAHAAVAALSSLQRWPVVTTNSDLLLEHAGVSPARLCSRAQVEAALSPHALQDRRVLICIGVGADHKSIIARFRELQPHGTVVAFIRGKAAPYLGSTDWLVEGDVQVTVPKLAEYLNDNTQMSQEG